MYQGRSGSVRSGPSFGGRLPLRGRNCSPVFDIDGPPPKPPDSVGKRIPLIHPQGCSVFEMHNDGRKAIALWRDCEAGEKSKNWPGNAPLQRSCAVGANYAAAPRASVARGRAIPAPGLPSLPTSPGRMRCFRPGRHKSSMAAPNRSRCSRRCSACSACATERSAAPR
jgi:hypothetical protein